MDIKDELSRVSIQITCYNRNGKVVKSVTSDDKGDVENPGSNDRLWFIKHEFQI